VCQVVGSFAECRVCIAHGVHALELISFNPVS
jgi:hypothetical protein